MSVREFKLPDLGEGVAEGEIISWLVEAGDEVTEDQPIAEVETDKALVEVPSPVDGVVKERRGAEGDVVPVGTVLVTFEVEDGEGTEEGHGTGEAESGDAAAADDRPTGGDAAKPSTEAGGEPASEERTAGRVFAPPSVRRLARELGVDLAAVAAGEAGGRLTEADVRAAAEGDDGREEDGRGGDPTTGRSEAAASEAEAETASGERGVRPAETAARERTLAAPATRRIARELGVDIDAVPAVEEREGEAFVTETAVREFAASAGDEAGERETRPGPVAGERVPYRGVRRTVGERMVESAFTAPHVTHHDEVAVPELVAWRSELKEVAGERGVSLTYVPFVLKAVVAALREYPYLNARLDEEADEILLHEEYHVGVATATDDGLMVPVVRNVDSKGVLDLASEVNELVARARDRSLAREDLQGSTFTVTNFGAIGGEYATPIINPPEVAILGLGAIQRRPWVEDDGVVARHTLPLSLSIDHRVVDGAVAAAFVNRLKELLGDPKRLLLE